jgi:hypothetical protein
MVLRRQRFNVLGSRLSPTESADDGDAARRLALDGIGAAALARLGDAARFGALSDICKVHYYPAALII